MLVCIIAGDRRKPSGEPLDVATSSIPPHLVNQFRHGNGGTTCTWHGSAHFLSSSPSVAVRERRTFDKLVISFARFPFACVFLYRVAGKCDRRIYAFSLDSTSSVPSFYCMSGNMSRKPRRQIANECY